MKRKETAELALFVANAVTSPLSLTSEVMNIRPVKNAIRRVITTTTLQGKVNKLAEANQDKFFGLYPREKGVGDVFAIVGSVRESERQLRRNIPQEIEKFKSRKPYEIAMATSVANENIFKNVKRTFGFSLGLLGDYISGGYNEALFGVPIPGASGLRDALFSHVPFLEHNPYLFGAFAVVAAAGLISGMINITQDGRFSRKANKLAIEKMKS